MDFDVFLFFCFIYSFWPCSYLWNSCIETNHPVNLSKIKCNYYSNNKIYSNTTRYRVLYNMKSAFKWKPQNICISTHLYIFIFLFFISILIYPFFMFCFARFPIAILVIELCLSATGIDDFDCSNVCMWCKSVTNI